MTYKETEVQAELRDAKLIEIGAGTNEVMRLIICAPDAGRCGESVTASA